MKINGKYAAALAVVLIASGIYVAWQVREFAAKAALADIDAGVSLGIGAANAVGNYLVKEGKPPQTLAELPEKFADTATAKVSWSAQAGEVAVTLKSDGNPNIDGKRMLFRPVIVAGMVISVACRTDADAAFRKLAEDHCD